MRVVGIAIITALLSAGCAIQAGEPVPEETQRPNELVGIGGGDQTGVIARPAAQTKTAIGQSGPQADSPNPSPWTNEGATPQAGTAGASSGGGSDNNDNPNPSPWENPSDPRMGNIGTTTGKGGTGTGG
ncbi:MAG TPA: hypothetical protein VF765_24870 [Polyangiaceae bacterium]